MSKSGGKSFLEGHLDNWVYNKPLRFRLIQQEERRKYDAINTRRKDIDIYKCTACDYEQERVLKDLHTAILRNFDICHMHEFSEAYNRSSHLRHIMQNRPTILPEVGWVIGEYSINNRRQNNARHAILYDLYKKNITPAFLDKPLLRPNPNKPWKASLKDWYTAGYFGSECDTIFYRDKSNNCASERWDKISKELDISIEPYNTPGENIVVIAQSRGSERITIDPGEWLVDTLTQLNKITDRKIVVMCTPETNQSYNFTLQKAVSKFKNTTCYIGEEDDILANIRISAHSVITYNSRLAVTTVLNGITTIATHKSSFIYELGNNHLSQIEHPVMSDREQWIYNLSYSQWSSEEIRKTKTFWYYYRKLYYGDVGYRV